MPFGQKGRSLEDAAHYCTERGGRTVFKIGGKVIFFDRMLQGTTRHFRKNKLRQKTVILIDRKNAGNPVWSAKTKHNQTANRKQVILGISYGG